MRGTITNQSYALAGMLGLEISSESDPTPSICVQGEDETLTIRDSEGDGLEFGYLSTSITASRRTLKDCPSPIKEWEGISKCSGRGRYTFLPYCSVKLEGHQAKEVLFYLMSMMGSNQKNHRSLPV